MEAKDRIIVALDVGDINQAIDLVVKLAPYVGAFKIGLEFITASYARLVAGPNRFSNLGKLEYLYGEIGSQLFWDGKWDDIPNTVAGASLGIQPLKPKYINVHASCGRESIRVAAANKGNSKLLGVTVLTSIPESECRNIFGEDPKKKVLNFAELLVDNGADGIICSPEELKILATHSEFDHLLKVTPGIRPEWAVVGDQKRIMTPGEAVQAAESVLLVIGRPITNPPADIGDPVEAAKRIIQEIQDAL